MELTLDGSLSESRDGRYSRNTPDATTVFGSKMTAEMSFTMIADQTRRDVESLHTDGEGNLLHGAGGVGDEMALTLINNTKIATENDADDMALTQIKDEVASVLSSWDDDMDITGTNDSKAGDWPSMMAAINDDMEMTNIDDSKMTEPYPVTGLSGSGNETHDADGNSSKPAVAQSSSTDPVVPPAVVGAEVSQNTSMEMTRIAASGVGLAEPSAVIDMEISLNNTVDGSKLVEASAVAMEMTQVAPSDGNTMVMDLSLKSMTMDLSSQKSTAMNMDLSQKSTTMDLSQKSMAMDLSRKSTAMDLSQKSTAMDLSQKSTAMDLSQISTAMDLSQKPTAMDRSGIQVVEPSTTVAVSAQNVVKGSADPTTNAKSFATVVPVTPVGKPPLGRPPRWSTASRSRRASRRATRSLHSESTTALNDSTPGNIVAVGNSDAIENSVRNVIAPVNVAAEDNVASVAAPGLGSSVASVTASGLGNNVASAAAPGLGNNVASAAPPGSVGAPDVGNMVTSVENTVAADISIASLSRRIHDVASVASQQGSVVRRNSLRNGGRRRSPKSLVHVPQRVSARVAGAVVSTPLSKRAGFVARHTPKLGGNVATPGTCTLRLQQPCDMELVDSYTMTSSPNPNPVAQEQSLSVPTSIETASDVVTNSTFTLTSVGTSSDDVSVGVTTMSRGDGGNWLQMQAQDTSLVPVDSSADTVASTDSTYAVRDDTVTPRTLRSGGKLAAAEETFVVQLDNSEKTTRSGRKRVAAVHGEMLWRTQCEDSQVEGDIGKSGRTTRSRRKRSLAEEDVIEVTPEKTTRSGRKRVPLGKKRNPLRASLIQKLRTQNEEANESVDVATPEMVEVEYRELPPAEQSAFASPQLTAVEDTLQGRQSLMMSPSGFTKFLVNLNCDKTLSEHTFSVDLESASPAVCVEVSSSGGEEEPCVVQGNSDLESSGVRGAEGQHTEQEGQHTEQEGPDASTTGCDDSSPVSHPSLHSVHHTPYSDQPLPSTNRSLAVDSPSVHVPSSEHHSLSHLPTSVSTPPQTEIVFCSVSPEAPSSPVVHSPTLPPDVAPDFAQGSPVIPSQKSDVTGNGFIRHVHALRTRSVEGGWLCARFVSLSKLEGLYMPLPNSVFCSKH
jgi:hypothetical protein